MSVPSASSKAPKRNENVKKELAPSTSSSRVDDHPVPPHQYNMTSDYFYRLSYKPRGKPPKKTQAIKIEYPKGAKRKPGHEVPTLEEEDPDGGETVQLSQDQEAVEPESEASTSTTVHNETEEGGRKDPPSIIILFLRSLIPCIK